MYATPLDHAGIPAQLPLVGVGVGVAVEVVLGFVVVLVVVVLVVVEDVEVGFTVEDGLDVEIAAPPQALIALQSLLGLLVGWDDADHFACHIYPPKDTVAPPA